jgi:hypothetical protein
MKKKWNLVHHIYYQIKNYFQTNKLIIMGQFWKWLKTRLEDVLAFNTLHNYQLWITSNLYLCYESYMSNNMFQKLSSTSTGFLFGFCAYTIIFFWKTPIESTCGFSKPRSLAIATTNLCWSTTKLVWWTLSLTTPLPSSTWINELIETISIKSRIWTSCRKSNININQQKKK